MRHSLSRALRYFGLASIAVHPLGFAAHADTGCDHIEANDTPLVTRRPVVGKRVLLAAGFGLRRHPLLDKSRLHAGIDWSAPAGTPVSAAGKGRVISAEFAGTYGNRVIIDHGGGWQTHYAQLSMFSVRSGDCVAANAVIGAVGSTGLSTGPHLHFEVRRSDQAVDPMLVPLRPEN